VTKEIRISKIKSPVEVVEEALKNSSGRVTVEEIAEKTGIDAEKVRKTLNFLAIPISDGTFVTEEYWETLKKMAASIVEKGIWKINEIAEMIKLPIKETEKILNEINAIMDHEIATSSRFIKKIKERMKKEKKDIRTIAEAFEISPKAVIWLLNLNIKDIKLSKVLKGHEDFVLCVAWSPNSRYVASGSKYRDKTIRVWDVESGKEVMVLRGHKSYVWSVAWSPDGRYIASGSNDETIRVWDVESGKEVMVLGGHEDVISSVAWSPDGRYIASGSDDETIRIWLVVWG